MDDPTPALGRLFQRIDAATGSFAQASGLACPPGCGACCHSPHVETTELEMLPMACHLAETGAAESVLARLAASPTPAPCVLFEPDPTHPGRGRCGHYAWRPSLCRLFGFAATRDKYGRLRLAACKIHKETRPETVQAAESGIESGTFSAPSFDDAANALLDIDPEVRSGHAPINTALRRALERVLWKQTLRDRTG